MERNEYAQELYAQGYNCAQRTAMAFHKDCGLTRDDMLRMASGFGAGMQRGEVCGAVSAGVLVLGLLYGHVDGHDEAMKQRLYGLVRGLHGAIEETHGSVLCRELIGLDLSTKEGMTSAWEQDLFQTTCKGVIGSVIDYIEARMK